MIWASSPEMTRGPAWCPCCLLHPGSPTPGCTLVKKHPTRCHYGSRAPCLHLLSLSAHTMFMARSWPMAGVAHPSRAASRPPNGRSSNGWRGPSKQGSFTPAKGPPQSKGRTGDRVGHARGLNRLWPGRMS